MVNSRVPCSIERQHARTCTAQSWYSTFVRPSRCVIAYKRMHVH